VITGASSGIGTYCAHYFDQRGFRVFATVRKEVDGERLREKATDRLTPVLCDVTNAAMIEDMRQRITLETGDLGLVGLVNNAGIACFAPIEIVPIDAFRMQLEVNVVGTVAVTQALLPLLRKGNGRVVNMSSVTGRMAVPMLGSYAASKYAVEALSDALRVELAPWGIHVSVIEPGVIMTPIWNSSLAYRDALLERVPAHSVELYQRAIQSMSHVATKAGEHGISPVYVARAVEHALTARRPKTRYLVGADAKFVDYILRPLPDRFRDWLFSRTIGFLSKVP
jgi:NAD(P)-dependent dehydrogenase (short-subunit alcohol dehydrogenase family)